jgi:hypothetical protein
MNGIQPKEDVMPAPLTSIDRLLGAPFDRFRRWWRNEALRREFEALPEPVRDALARETGIGSREAARMIADHPGPARLMPQRLAAAGLEAGTIEAEQPLLYRDMVRTCANCEAWRRCERDLRYEDVRPVRWDYCPNDGNVDALLRRGRSVDRAADTR